MGKGSFILGLAVGYVLGARAGRERYDQLKGQASGVWQSPRVQSRVDTAKQTAKSATDTAKQKVRGRVPGSGSAPETSTGSSPSAWAHESPPEG